MGGEREGRREERKRGEGRIREGREREWRGPPCVSLNFFRIAYGFLSLPLPKRKKWLRYFETKATVRRRQMLDFSRKN